MAGPAGVGATALRQVESDKQTEVACWPDVWGEEVVHLVPEGRLTQQPAPPHKVADGDVEVVIARAPVADLGEWVYGQDVLEWGHEEVWSGMEVEHL